MSRYNPKFRHKTHEIVVWIIHVWYGKVEIKLLFIVAIILLYVQSRLSAELIHL